MAGVVAVRSRPAFGLALRAVAPGIGKQRRRDAGVFALVTIGARADQVIAGTAVTLGAVGLTGTIYRQAYGAAGAGLDLPTLAAIPIPWLSTVPVLGPAIFSSRRRPISACSPYRWSGGFSSARDWGWR
jgi:ABC-type uncharacterized transport system permease subunit